MIEMNDWATKAVAKLKEESKKVIGRKEKAMAPAVMDAIQNFCLQDEKFAKAVVHRGTFADCMKHVASGVGNSISDLDAYKKAVQFYIPGAKVGMKMWVETAGEQKRENEPAESIKTEFSLDDFLQF